LGDAVRQETHASRSLWREPGFLKLWSAETISHFGTQVSRLAVPLVAVLLLEVSPFEFALLGTIEFLPFVLFSLPAGVWVDRLRRRPILILADLGRGISLASIPLAYLTDTLTIWQLYVVGFVNGVMTVFFDIAYQSYLPSLVERKQINDGNAKLETSRSVAQIAGPGFAGALIAAFTAPIAIVVDSLSFALSAWFVWLIRKREVSSQAHASRQGSGRGMRAEIADGLRYVLRHRYLKNIAACTATGNLFAGVTLSIFLLYLARDIGLSPAVIGIVLAAGNTGPLAGAVLANRIAKTLGVGRTILFSAMLMGPPLLLVPLAPREPGPLTFCMLAASSFIVGFAAVVYNITQVSLRQALTPERMQGRMNATMRFIVWGTIPAGQMLGGAMASMLGTPVALWLGAIGVVFSFLPILLSDVPSIRDMPAQLEQEEPSATS
jgi:MFS family permease